jgi:beta-1,4-N-acetylglucosaminyltransferase
MTKILVILGEGGHTVQMLKLVEMLGSGHDYSYLIPRRDQVSEGKIRIAGSVYRADLPRAKNAKPWTTLLLLPLCSVQEFLILLRVRPKVILSAGAGIAVPIAVFGRLLGAKIIHVESASRVRALSVSGKIMYRVAHLFFVQWERLTAQYPKAVFAGRLL